MHMAAIDAVFLFLILVIMLSCEVESLNAAQTTTRQRDFSPFLVAVMY